MENGSYDRSTTGTLLGGQAPAPTAVLRDHSVLQTDARDDRPLRIAADAAGIALWSWNVDTDEIALDERAQGLWGVPGNERVTFEDLSAHMHPGDLDRVRVAFTDTRAVPGTYEIDFRVLHGDTVRWVSARGQGGDGGIAVARQRALADLRAQVASISIELAEKIVERNIGPSTQEQLIESYISSVGSR